jgi:hypothetical protein
MEVHNLCTIQFLVGEG